MTGDITKAELISIALAMKQSIRAKITDLMVISDSWKAVQMVNNLTLSALLLYNGIDSSYRETLRRIRELRRSFHSFIVHHSRAHQEQNTVIRQLNSGADKLAVRAKKVAILEIDQLLGVVLPRGDIESDDSD